MKHLIAIAIMICGTALSSCMAQAPGVQQEPLNGGKLESLKIGYLTQRMNLTPDEAQRFWPIYNQYTAEMRQVQLSFRDNRDEIGREEAVLNIRKKYNSLFFRALPHDKVNLFFRSEMDFNNFVRREFIQRRQQRMMQQPRRAPNQLMPRRFGQ